MGKNHILRDYNRATDGVLGDLALHISTLLTLNTNFPTPAVAPLALSIAANSFNSAVAAAVHGTPANTLAKNTLRTALIALLDQEATYVELVANNDPAKILSSGFSLASNVRTPAAPGMSAILLVTNVATGKLGVDLKVADNAWAYIVEYTAQPGGAVKTATFTNPHDAVLTNLTAGSIYSLRVKVMASGNQESEWSDAVSHMAI